MTPNHKARIITGLIMAAALLGALFAGGWIFFALILLVSLVAQWEFNAMFGSGFGLVSIVSLLGGLTLVADTFMHGQSHALYILVAFFLLIAFFFLVKFGVGRETSFYLAARSICGIIYIPLSLQFALNIEPLALLPVFIATAATDIGGYYAGTTYGTHPLWPTVSPRKSWEGSVFGLLVCVAIVALYGKFVLGGPWWGWFGLAFLLSVAAQLGDLFESALKRTAGVKDSSRLIPGHGGVLDRIDSLLFALPVYVIFRALFLSEAPVTTLMRLLPPQ